MLAPVFHLLTDLEVVIAMVEESGEVLHQVEALQPVVQDAGVLHPLVGGRGVAVGAGADLHPSIV